jgi:hypothetical protein
LREAERASDQTHHEQSHEINDIKNRDSNPCAGFLRFKLSHAETLRPSRRRDCVGAGAVCGSKAALPPPPRQGHIIESMSVEEELQEHAEHAQGPFDKRVAATMAIIAAFLAIVSVAGHIMTTEELLSQQKASDQWSYYQAKSIRRYESEIARDMFAAMKNEKQSEQYTKNAEKYRKDDEEIQKEARGLENESHLRGRQALRLHFGEVFLEVSIVFASLAILSKRPLLWYLSIAGGATGIVIAASTLLVK